MQVDATIFGGLPVVVEARLLPADRSMGIAYAYYEIDGIYTTRVRKRDRRVVMKPIPQSWWDRLDRSGELDALAEEVAGGR
ncbi:hypothetical protein [Nitratireductor sp. OM-1]|uniref:hypothetical protein n=1 Tax=Nitratireductor sp. OM-1 TaxID=1756988 RepID=UPI000DDE1C44|nr:hypothetical protein [Nitratireductor sp. OM-1]